MAVIDDKLLTPRQRQAQTGGKNPSIRHGQRKAYETGRISEAKKTHKPRITPDQIWAKKGLFSNPAYAPMHVGDGDDTEAPIPETAGAKTVPAYVNKDKTFFKGPQSDRAKTLGVTKIVQYPREPIGQYDEAGGYSRYGGTEGVSQNGHYILFYINVSERSKMTGLSEKTQSANAKAFGEKRKQKENESNEVFKARKENSAKAFKLSNEFNRGAGSTRGSDAVFENRDVGTTISRHLNSGLAGARAANDTEGGDESLYAKKISQSKRLSTAVALYMPAQVQTSYALQYSDVEYGFKAQAFGQLFDMIDGQQGAVQGSQITAGARKMAQGVLNTVAPGATAAVNIKQGVVVSNRMELSFQGVNRREFQFTFNFLPKSEMEAIEVEDIISIFKYYSHPDFVAGSAGNMMTIPDTFDISYMYQGAENSFLNKISTCFCTNIAVTYGGDRYSTHTPTVSRHGQGALSPPPVRSSLTMTFKELEILTKPRIDQGY